MPSLRKRNRSGKRTVWDIRYWQDGKRRVYSIGETDRRTAEKIYHEFCARLAEGRHDGTAITVEESTPATSGPSLSQLATQAKIYADGNKSPKTAEREQDALQQILQILGDIPLSDITTAKMEEYKAARLRAAAGPTVNIEIRVLNTALNQAVALGWLKGTSSPGFKQLKLADAEPPEWLDDEQIEILLSTTDAEFRRFMAFLLYTGCRRNEALGLQWGDVNLPRRQIVIRGQIGKMGKRRTIPVNGALAEVLAQWPEPRDGLLFPKYGPNQVSMKFRRWVKEVGLPKGISVHSLRATFACHLIEKGVDIYTVSKLLGHSSVKVTERHYLALDPKHVQEAVARLDYGKSLQPNPEDLMDGDDDNVGPN